jgi:hypothetical protein
VGRGLDPVTIIEPLAWPVAEQTRQTPPVVTAGHLRPLPVRVVEDAPCRTLVPTSATLRFRMNENPGHGEENAHGTRSALTPHEASRSGMAMMNFRAAVAAALVLSGSAWAADEKKIVEVNGTQIETRGPVYVAEFQEDVIEVSVTQLEMPEEVIEVSREKRRPMARNAPLAKRTDVKVAPPRTR